MLGFDAMLVGFAAAAPATGITLGHSPTNISLERLGEIR
jgi:hypothetical protein